MDDVYDTERPTAAELEAQKAAILAFRARHQGATKVAMAIAFVRERGSATSAELHLLMGLEATDSVSTYLASATKTDRLVKEGKIWTLGPNALPKAPDALQSGSELVKRDKPLEVPVFVPPPASKVEAKPEPKPETNPAPKASACRFAVWSDGQVEIAKRNEGVMLAMSLTLDEVAEFLEFIEKVGAA